MEIHCTVSSFSAHSHSNHAGNGVVQISKNTHRADECYLCCAKINRKHIAKHSSNNLEYRFLISYNDYIAMCKQLKYKVFWHIITDKIVG